MIAALVLAAGSARRFGSHKLVADLAGRPLVRATVETVLASRVDATVVVLGHGADAVRAALHGLPLRFVVNPEHVRGMSTSLRRGLDALDAAAEAAVVALADQPLPTPAILDRLVEAYRDSGAPIVAPLYAGRRGNPVLFASSLFDELRAVTGDQGAREVIAVDPARVVHVSFPFAAPRDVDTPEDLAGIS